MANSAQRGTSDFNTEIIQEFRADQGRAGFLAGTPDDSHPPHRRQVWDRVRHAAGLQPQPDGRFAIVAANGGSPTHPDWYYNLKANPCLTAEAGTHTFTVVTEELHGSARAELWPKLVA